MEHPPSFDDGRHPFDQNFSNELVGKHVLVGITYMDRRGEVTGQEQFHGYIRKADVKMGFCLILSGDREGEEYWLPPDSRNFFVASRGEYRLRSTGEVVIDPDYTSMWTIEQTDDA